MVAWYSQHEAALLTFPQAHQAKKVLEGGSNNLPLALYWMQLAEWQLSKTRREATAAILWRIKHGRYMESPEHFTVAILGEDGRVGTMSTRPNQKGLAKAMHDDFDYAKFAMEPARGRPD